MITLIGWGLGFVGGMRHALEPDHLAAVTTLVAGERSARRAMRFAAAWGFGHGLMLVGVGGLLFALRTALTTRVSEVFELLVAVMLVGLGLRALVVARRLATSGVATVHRHASLSHVHAHAAPHLHVGRWSWARLPFAVGLVHGLAGSGALTALALSRLPSLAAGLWFMAIYAAGAIAGMAVLAGVAGVPVARLAVQPRMASAMLHLSGVFSLAIGAWWAWPILAGP